MTPEVWMTLVAGIIGAVGAIAGVMLQGRFEQRDRRREETRQRNEIARALLFEIYGFVRDYLIPSKDALSTGSPQSDPRSVSLKPPPANTFPVYYSNAQRIGGFDDGEVEAIVTFYNVAASVATMLQEAITCHTQIYIAHSNVQAESVLKEIHKRLSEVVPRAIERGAIAKACLEKRAGIGKND
jgi:hypothetical protein